MKLEKRVTVKIAADDHDACRSYAVLRALSNYGRAIIFSPCGFFLLSSFFPRLISAAADWMFTILRHMVWP